MPLLPLSLSQQHSCFVALPSSVARPILSSSEAGNWSVLRVSWEHGGALQRAYVAWSGAVGASMGLEVPSALGHALGLGALVADMPQAAVQVEPAGFIPVARSVEIEPLDVDDWEILELRAGHLEATLLDQLCVLATGQTFPIWISEHSFIMMKVVGKLESECVRLTRDSQVMVAPKRRKIPGGGGGASSTGGGRAAEMRRRRRRRRMEVRVQSGIASQHTPAPGSAALPATANWCRMHPATLAQLDGASPATAAAAATGDVTAVAIWTPRSTSTTTAEAPTMAASPPSSDPIEELCMSEVAVAAVTEDEGVVPGHVVLGSATRLQLGSTSCSSVQLRVIEQQDSEGAASGAGAGGGGAITIRLITKLEGAHNGGNAAAMDAGVLTRHFVSWLQAGGKVPLSLPGGLAVLPPTHTGGPCLTVLVGVADARAERKEGEPAAVMTKHGGRVLAGQAVIDAAWVTPVAPDSSGRLVAPFSVSALPALACPALWRRCASALGDEPDPDADIGLWCGPADVTTAAADLEDVWAEVAQSTTEQSSSLPPRPPSQRGVAGSTIPLPTLQASSGVAALGAEFDSVAARIAPTLCRSAAAARVRLGTPLPGGMYVHGLPGTGKTVFLRAVARAFASHADSYAHVEWVACRDLQGRKTSAVRRALRRAWARARAYAPSLLVLDDLDALAPPVDSGGGGGPPAPGQGRIAEEMADMTLAMYTAGSARETTLRAMYAAARRMTAATREADVTHRHHHRLDYSSTSNTSSTSMGYYESKGSELAEAGGAGGAGGVSPRTAQPPEWLEAVFAAESTMGDASVAILASCRDDSSLDGTLMRCGIIDHDVKLPAPDAKGRAEVLNAIFLQRQQEQRGAARDRSGGSYSCWVPDTDLDLSDLAGRCEGYTGKDLRTLFDRAAHAATARLLRERQSASLSSAAAAAAASFPLAAASESNHGSTDGTAAVAAPSLTSNELGLRVELIVAEPAEAARQRQAEIKTAYAAKFGPGKNLQSLLPPPRDDPSLASAAAWEVDEATGRDRGATSGEGRGAVMTSHAITLGDFDEALDGFTPASLQGAALFKSDTKWSDVGGLEEVRRTLKETLEMPAKFAQLYDASPLRLPSGVLLFGPPGCGKTLLAGAVASECGLNFISVKGPEVLNKYIGASEQAVRDLFGRAAAAAPSVLFFDEFDAVAPRRGADSTGVTDRVVNQLLTFLDGVEARKGVYVMAATSRPDLVDPALLRPGRLDKQLFCNFPDLTDRTLILKAVATRMDLGGDLAGTAADELFAHIATTCSKFTGADLQAVLYSAQLSAVHGSLDLDALRGSSPSSKVDGPGAGQATGPAVATAAAAAAADKPVVTQSLIMDAVREARPSMTPEERARYEAIYAKFIGGRTPDGADSATDSGYDPRKQRTALA